MDGCADATVEKTPSHRSQCGGFAVSQNSNAQSSHAHARCRFLLFILLTINDCGKSHMHRVIGTLGFLAFGEGVHRWRKILECQQPHSKVRFDL
jgi:hypothetical protein